MVDPMPMEFPDTPWTALDKLVTDYVDGYELRDCEDADGNTGDYDPNEHERGLIMDAIQGLIGDDDFMDKIAEAREFTKANRRADGECESCGRKLPDHWGSCRQSTSACGETPK